MAKIRVMVVDDSVVVRRLVGDVLSSDPDLEVVGTAVNGKIAVAKVDQLKPDLVTMDVEMPELDGVSAVRELRAKGVRVPIIMFSTLTERGATATLDALAAGATDYVAKPANVGSVSRSIEQVRTTLIPKIKALAARPRRSAVLEPAVAGSDTPVAAPAAAAAPAAPAVGDVIRLAPRQSAIGSYKALVVGSSTGGPEALGRFLAALPALPVPVVVVQHMPAVFTKQFAMRLDRQLAVSVSEAVDGQLLAPGTVTVAPGDHHLHLAASGQVLRARLSQEPPVNYCRPAVDVLFRSAVDACGARVLGVVLTGMGHDGCAGARAIVSAGGSVVAQDRATSVVWGMPGAVATAGLAEEVLPLEALAPSVAKRLTGVLAGGAAR